MRCTATAYIVWARFVNHLLQKYCIRLQMKAACCMRSITNLITDVKFKAPIVRYDCRQLPLPPGPWVVPYIGDTFRFMYEGLIQISTERMPKYGLIHRTWILGERNVFVADAACVRKILNGEHTIAEGKQQY